MEARPAVGALLKHWRGVRSMSQLELASRAGVSTRHVSFVECGRARASREMIHLLAEALDVPLRERNALLSAAGFATAYTESALDAADLATVKHALVSLLARLEPFPGAVLDRHWNVQLANRGALALLAVLLAPEELAALQPLNAAKLVFTPAVRPKVKNWNAVAGDFIQRLHREALSGDQASRAIVDEILAMPDVPRTFFVPDLERPSLPVLPLEIEHQGHVLRFFTTITTLGTPLDVTLQELRIETYVPMDEGTEALLRSLLG
jgi:transcriptional regulator with XRE-family HTH domain